MIHSIHEVRHPTGVGLDADDLQVRVPLEHAAEHEHRHDVLAAPHDGEEAADGRPPGSHPPRCSCSKRTPLTLISDGALPAAATNPIGTGRFMPSITYRSPTPSPPSTTWGALSRHLGSMYSV